MPLALLEAMQAGLPVVATRVGGIPEAVEDGVSGILVEPRRPDLLATAITALATDPERRRALGQGAAARVRSELTARRMVERTAALYAELVAAARTRSGRD
jgi:glycosyltransferase involved in cell wall biosynthesis